MRWVLTVLCACFALAGCGDTPTCKKGKPCGDTCIDKDKECHR
jgi:hypothetical protein